MSDKSVQKPCQIDCGVRSKRPTKMSGKDVVPTCQEKKLNKSVSQKCHKNLSKKSSYKSVKQECPAICQKNVSGQSVL